MSEEPKFDYHRKPWTCQFEITYGDRVVAKVVSEDESLVNLMTSAGEMHGALAAAANTLLKALHAGRGLTLEETAALKTLCVRAICGAQGVDIPEPEPGPGTQTFAKHDEGWIVPMANEVN